MSDRKVFQDSVTPLPEQSGLTHNGPIVNAAGPEHHDEKMTVLFSLEIPPEAQAQLEERVAKGEVVPLEELQKNYGPNTVDRDALVSWLKAQGFEITQVSADGTSIYARASVDQIAQSLAVNLVRVTKDGITYTAAQNAPSLPADVGKSVHAIIGLQPFRQVHKQSRKYIPLHDNGVSLDAKGAASAALAPNIQSAPPYLVP